jgi:hemolysin activation/secretion protein
MNLSLLFTCNASAGFLEMPDISEVPDLERQSMLRDLDIPSVRERSPDPEAGPRLAVSAFRLQGIVEFPELGITREDINKIVEEIRHDLMAEDKLLDSGYTLEELGEISNMLVKIEEETLDRHVSSLEVQQLVWLVRDQRARRGITLGQIESIADKITRFYRERGFILAKAYIPQQQVRDGVVNLTMLLGLLGEVRAIDNTMYEGRLLESVFDDTLTKPVTNDIIEERLYFINDFPGISAQGFFEPGSQVGDTRLNIKVNTEKRFDGTVRLDNHGTENTGEQRLYAELITNNPLGNGDALLVGLLNAASPSNTTYWQLNYQTPLFSPRWKLKLGAATNQFVVDQDESSVLSSQELSGETEQMNVAVNYVIKRSRKNNYNVGLKYENILSDLTLGNISSISERLDDEVNNTSLIYNYDVLNEEDRILHQGSVNLVSGEFVKGVEPASTQEETYAFLGTDYTMLTFWKLPYFDTNTRIILRASAQYADLPLSSINQFSLGGATRVRAYPTDMFSADSAIYTGLEWIFNSPDLFNFGLFSDVKFGQISQPFFFADYAYGVSNSLDAAAEDDTASLFDVGLGLKFSYLNDFKGNLQIAFPISSVFSSPDLQSPEDDIRIVFDFQYSFL